MLEKSTQGILFSCKADNILIINLSSSDTYYIKIYISYKENQELNLLCDCYSISIYSDEE